MIEPNTVAPIRQRFLTDARAILRLGGPLLVNNVSIAGMGFTDTVMAGRLSAQDLAAVAIGSAFHIFFYLAGLGTLMAMSPWWHTPTGRATANASDRWRDRRYG